MLHCSCGALLLIFFNNYIIQEFTKSTTQNPYFTGFYAVDFYFNTRSIVLISLAFFNYEKINNMRRSIIEHF